MKILAALLLLAVAAPVAAEGTVELLLGPAIPLTKVAGTGGSDALASRGLSFGGRFMTKTATNFSVGGEVQSVMPGDHSSTLLISNANTTSKFSSTMLFAEVKAAVESGSIRPFLIGGLGFHSTTVKATSTPLPGFVWPDTGTGETRTIINATKSGFGITLQGGLDIPIQERFSFGLSAAWYALGKQDYGGLSGSLSTFSVLASLGVRFS